METIRDVTKTECPWLDEDIKKGQEVFRYKNYTYGCISPSGIAVTIMDGVEPFFELPREAVKEI